MALTYAEVEGARGEGGWIRETFFDITLDNSYPTGGETIAAKNVGLQQLFGLDVIGQGLVSGSAPTSAYFFEFNPYTGKLQAFEATAAGSIAAHSHTLNLKNAAVADGATTRVNAGTNLLGANTGSDISIAGGGANGGIANATTTLTGTPGPLTEVANATDLSTIKIRVRCTGT